MTRRPRKPINGSTQEAGDRRYLLPPLLLSRHFRSTWLAAKSAAEKGFSLGFFDEAYLQRFPVAVIERHGRVEAFANVWCSSDNTELSVDLMRHRTGAPNGVMEALFVHLMLWGQQQRLSIA